MSKNEHSPLLGKQQRQAPNSTPLLTLPHHSPSSSAFPTSAPSINNSSLLVPPRQNRSETMQSEVSVRSLFGSEASPRDVQELLDNLDRATNLLRRHIQEEQGERGHVLVSRPLIPRWITSYLLLITFIWQALNVGFLEVIEAIKTNNSTHHELELASNIVMTVFQAVHLLLVFFVSFKLVKKVLHRTASGSLLAQSYLSTVLLFAGFYMLEYRFKPKGFVHVFDNTSNSQSLEMISNKRPTLLFLRMLYFSVSTATLCGTSEVEPLEWYNTVTVSIQMLMSFVYFASILSLGVVRQRKTTQPPTTSKSLTQRFRSWLNHR